MQLHGIGVGRGVAVGPMLTMPDPLPEPGERQHAGDAVAEKAAVASAVVATSSMPIEASPRIGTKSRRLADWSLAAGRSCCITGRPPKFPMRTLLSGRT